jgi:hypothetical protein
MHCYLLTHCHHQRLRVSRPSRGRYMGTLRKLRLRCRLRLFLLVRLIRLGQKGHALALPVHLLVS